MTRRRGAAAAIIGLAAGSVYLMLVMYLRIDGYLFPANEASIPGVPVFVPGTNLGVDVTLPGVSSPGEKAWTPDSRLNILVLGLDRPRNVREDQPSRSDTIFVASIDKQEGRLQLLAFPRDLWAEIPYGDGPGIWSEAKINAAHQYGVFYGYPGGGPAAAVAAIEHNYQIDIHHYVVIDWIGFVSLIDAIGGIDITVPEEISDFGTDALEDFPNTTVPAGAQHMSGDQALGYSRVRVDGDLMRIERQQVVIRAVAVQAVSLGLVPKLLELYGAYKDAVKTDIDNGLAPGYALLARDIDFENIETFSVGAALYSGIAEDGSLILLPNRDEMYAIIDQFFADPELRDEAPVVAVEYPEGHQAEAEEARAHLTAYGVPPAAIVLVKGAGAGEAGIFAVTGKPYTPKKMAQLFDLRLREGDGGAPDGVDVLVRLGEATALKSP